MTLRFLLDTSIVSAPMAKAPDAEILRRLGQRSHESGIAAPVWHELIYGCRRLPRGKRRTALEAYLAEVVHPTFPILPYDEGAAAWHGAERARLENLGEPLPFVDGQIAAIAGCNGLTLATLNTKDFVRFKDLRLEDWSRREVRS